MATWTRTKRIFLENNLGQLKTIAENHEYLDFLAESDSLLENWQAERSYTKPYGFRADLARYLDQLWREINFPHDSTLNWHETSINWLKEKIATRDCACFSVNQWDVDDETNQAKAYEVRGLLYEMGFDVTVVPGYYCIKASDPRWDYFVEKVDDLKEFSGMESKKENSEKSKRNKDRDTFMDAGAKHRKSSEDFTQKGSFSKYDKKTGTPIELRMTEKSMFICTRDFPNHTMKFRNKDTIGTALEFSESFNQDSCLIKRLQDKKYIVVGTTKRSWADPPYGKWIELDQYMEKIGNADEKFSAYKIFFTHEMDGQFFSVAKKGSK